VQPLGIPNIGYLPRMEDFSIARACLLQAIGCVTETSGERAPWGRAFLTRKEAKAECSRDS